ncbi:MAG: hypothetical protein ACTSPV_11400 [Candidatus Hodarchaeales archaeon]
MPDTPDRLNIDREDRSLYQQVTENSDLLRGKNNKEQFLFALAIGFHHKTRVPLKAKEGFFLKKDLKIEDESLINAVALAETHSVGTLADGAEVFRIVEEYAHAGIAIICDRISTMEYGSFAKQYEKELKEIWNEINKNNKEG